MRNWNFTTKPPNPGLLLYRCGVIYSNEQTTFNQLNKESRLMPGYYTLETLHLVLTYTYTVIVRMSMARKFLIFST